MPRSDPPPESGHGEEMVAEPLPEPSSSGAARGSEARLYADELTALFDQHFVHLVIFLRAMDRTLDLPDAEDVAQDAFAITHRRWSEVRGYDNPAGFLFETAHRCSKNHRRSRQRKQTASLDENHDQPGHPDDLELRIDLRDCLGRLPARQREVFLLREVIGFDVNETARILRISPGTVKSTKTDALRNLRAMFVEDTALPQHGRERRDE